MDAIKKLTSGNTANESHRAAHKIHLAKMSLRDMEIWEKAQALAANLMAAEDLTVVFDANITAPAHIDVKRRIVRVAQLIPEQSFLVPGLICHEIGHALWTRGNEPVDPILNIIEDGFIERMVSKKYPGALKHLRTIFNEFFEGDEADDPVDEDGNPIEMSMVVEMINTMNYNCKGIKFGRVRDYPEGTMPEDIKFFQKEVELCNLPTLKERADLARRTRAILKKYMNGREQMQQLMQQMMKDMGIDPDDLRGKPQQGEGKGEGQKQRDAGPGINWDDDDPDNPKKPQKQSGQGDNKEGDDKDGTGPKKKKDGKGDDEPKVRKEAGPNGEKDADAAKNGDDGDESGDCQNGDGDESGEGEPGDGDEPGEGQDGEGEGKDGEGEGKDGEGEGEGKDGEAKGQGEGEGEDGDGDSDGDGDDQSGNQESENDLPQDSQGNIDNSTENAGHRGARGGGRHVGTATQVPVQAVKDDGSWLDEHLANEENGKINDHHEKFETRGKNSGQICVEMASPEAVYTAANKSDITQMPKVSKRPSDAGATKRIHNSFEKDIREARKTAQIMYQRFILKRNAMELQATTYERSGSLDINRLVHYRTDDDIFITKRMQPQGSNHGVCLVLDWSGSMSSLVQELWKRSAEFIEFAKLSNVRVSVWLYTTDDHPPADEKAKLKKFVGMAINHGRFIKIVDTGQSSPLDSRDRLFKFWRCCQSLGHGGGYGRGSSVPYHLHLGGTNIVEGHAFGSHVVQNFEVDKKSVVVVTDGDDSSWWGDWVNPYDGDFIPGDDGKAMEGTDSNPGNYEVVLHGKPFPESSQGGVHMSSGYGGARRRALLGQVRANEEIGIKTIGIYLGNLNPDSRKQRAAPYDENFITWGNLSQGNRFIAQLIDQIS